MCEFVEIFFMEGQKVQTKYRVLNFAFETSECWFFNVRIVAVKVHGKIYDKEVPAKVIGFPKHKQEKIDGESCTIDLMPPRFYNRLRNKAIDEGHVRLQGDDAPMPKDAEFFDDVEESNV